MAGFESPSIFDGRSVEQNLTSIRTYLKNLSDQLNFETDNIDDRLVALESRVARLEKHTVS